LEFIKIIQHLLSTESETARTFRMRVAPLDLVAEMDDTAF
jgi:hypothetical protein